MLSPLSRLYLKLSLVWCHSSEHTYLAPVRPNWLRQSARLMKPMRLAAFAVVCGGLVALLSSCATSGAVSECAWVEPIHISEGDTLTDDTALALLTHNEQWDELSS